MRDHLVSQICSENIFDMIYDNAEAFGGKEKYGPLREVLLLLIKRN